MQYQNIKYAKFLSRPNRFIAHITIDGKEQIAHVKNTGRCKELLVPGAGVILEAAQNPNRKTLYSLIGVMKGDILINIDSQVPNQVVFEAIEQGLVKEIGKVKLIKKEVKYGNSRFDIYFESETEKGFIEVKGVTLENSGVAMFPDAPTQRGTKHILEMIKAVEEGYAGYIVFLIQMKPVTSFVPNKRMDPVFAEALKTAAQKGVKILAYDALVKPDSIIIGQQVPVDNI